MTLHPLPTAALVAAALPAVAQALPPGAEGSLQDGHKATVRAYLEAVGQGVDAASWARYFAPDLRFNGSRDLGPLLQRHQAIRRGFPDHTLVIEDQIAEGDKVVTRVSFRGTHLGEFMGIAPTGRRVEYAGTAIDRLADGRVVEMWHLTNTWSLLQQIGAAPAPRP